jgi:exodeoxyribonuclease VII small subunit
MVQQKRNVQEALQKLEQLVQELEQKDVDVEAGLQKFREGVDLVKFCQKELGQAENEFKKIKQELEQDSPTNENTP